MVNGLMIKNKLAPLFRLYKIFLAKLFESSYILINMLPRGKISTSIGLEKIWNRLVKIRVNESFLYFHSPNWLTDYRARTLLTKEPETIAWIDQIPEGSTFYDVGANIGIYSIYGAIKRNLKVVSVEPSPLNLELLFRNIQSNQLQSKITIVPIALSNEDNVQNLYMQQGDNIWGGAHNSSGDMISQDGNMMANFIVSSQLAMKMDSLILNCNLPVPRFLKIDVDGLEILVLEGALTTLRGIRELLIEVDQKNIGNNRKVENLLKNTGFTQLEYIRGIKLIENQIWHNALVGK
jgi:FkbM family methyltransferase